MTSTALEKLRQRYQDIEDHRKQAVKLLLNQPRTVKEEAYVTHHTARLAREIQSASQEILTALRTPIPRSPDPLTAFYTDLERRIEFHQQMAETSAEPPPAPEEAGDAVASESMNDMVFDIKGNAHLSLFYDNDRYQEWRRQKKSEAGKQKKATKRRIVISENDEALRKFSGEECFGQFLDLYDVHRALCALPARNHPNYIQFLEMLSRNEFDFAARGPEGEKLLDLLVANLSSFVERSEPFFDLNRLKESGERLSLQQRTDDPHGSQYCEYCDRAFDSEELYQVHLGHKSHSRNVAKADALGGVARLTEERRARKHRYDRLCATACSLLAHLNTKLAATIENCKRRQTLPASVIQAEQNLDAPLVFDESDDEAEAHFYNPKGLPLGWDGKPIPYWLYKLHGLSVVYKCEICGNRSYWGALAFERHFFDNRHMNCLKALGIPPTRHFVYVTGVNEAIALFEKIKRSLTREVWQPGEEEVETDDGQVMSLKTYQDLVRQGIIRPNAST
jgi:splicing factor 3A subunit 3